MPGSSEGVRPRGLGKVPAGWPSRMALERLWWGEAFRPAAHPGVVHLCGAVEPPHLDERHHGRTAAAPAAVTAGSACGRGWRVGGLHDAEWQDACVCAA